MTNSDNHDEGPGCTVIIQVVQVKSSRCRAGVSLRRARNWARISYAWPGHGPGTNLKLLLCPSLIRAVMMSHIYPRPHAVTVAAPRPGLTLNQVELRFRAIVGLGVTGCIGRTTRTSHSRCRPGGRAYLHKGILLSRRHGDIGRLMGPGKQTLMIVHTSNRFDPKEHMNLGTRKSSKDSEHCDLRPL